MEGSPRNSWKLIRVVLEPHRPPNPLALADVHPPTAKGQKCSCGFMVVECHKSPRRSRVRIGSEDSPIRSAGCGKRITLPFGGFFPHESEARNGITPVAGRFRRTRSSSTDTLVSRSDAIFPHHHLAVGVRDPAPDAVQRDHVELGQVVAPGQFFEGIVQHAQVGARGVGQVACVGGVRRVEVGAPVDARRGRGVDVQRQALPEAQFQVASGRPRRCACCLDSSASASRCGASSGSSRGCSPARRCSPSSSRSSSWGSPEGPPPARDAPQHTRRTWQKRSKA